MNNLHDTLALMVEMHAGVNDWTGVPYATHPVAVMLLLPPECDADDRHIALLHDVFEDCKLQLAEKFDIVPSLNIVDFVDSLLNVMTGLYSYYVLDGLRLLTRDM